MKLESISILLLFAGVGLVVGQSGRLIFNEGLFVLDWALNDDQSSITFKANVSDVSGWIGIGWSMIDRTSGDLIIAEVNAEDKTKLDVRDFWGFRQGPPVVDQIQNADNSTGYRDATARTAYMEFSRFIITNDTIEDYNIPLDGIYIMWAFSDGETFATNHLHRDYSRQKIIFAEGDSPEIPETTEYDHSPTTSITTLTLIFSVFILVLCWK